MINNAEAESIKQKLIEQIKEETGTGDGFDEKQSLLTIGISSIDVMHIMSYWMKQGYKIAFSKLVREPYVDKWAELIASSPKKVKKQRDTQPTEEKTADMYEPFPLTDVQYAYWIGRNKNQYLGGVGCHGYFESDCKVLDMDKLNAAWKVLFEYHPMLRAKYLSDGRQQVMKAPYRSVIPVRDMRALSEADREQKLLGIRKRSSHRLLNIEAGEVIALNVSRLTDDEWRLHFEIDLLVCDVQSFRIILRDLAAYYVHGTLPPVQKEWNFAEYIRRDTEAKKTERQQAQEYWNEKIKTVPDSPKLPMVRKSTSEEDLVFHRHRYCVSQEKTDVILRRCGEHGVTLAAALLTAYGLAISKWSDNKHFLMNMPLFNRDTNADIDDVVADFTNLLLVDMDFTNVRSFSEHLAEVSGNLLTSMDNSSYSGVKILRDLRKARGTTVTAPIVFSCNLGDPLVTENFNTAFGGISYMISQTPQVLLDFQAFNAENGLEFIWDAADDMFPEGLIDEIFACFNEGIEKLADSSISWEDIRGFEAPSQRRHRAEAESFEFDFSKRRNMTEGIISHAEKTPDAPAIIDPVKDRVYTYGEVLAGMKGITAALRKNGMKKGDTVAVFVPRGAECIISEIGVIYGGGTYVPISTSQPAERMKSILSSSDCRYILCSKQKPADDFENTVRICIEDCITSGEEAEPAEITGDETAYIIFTSGSTGTPKGVQISHKAAMSTIDEVNRMYSVTSADRAIGVSSNDFDLSVYDIFGMLNEGASLVAVPDEIRRSARDWYDIIRKYNVTVWNSVPTLLKMLLIDARQESENLDSLRLVMLSGDWIDLDLPQKLSESAPDAHMVSLGGATEAAIWSNFFDVSLPVPAHWASIPYGAPLPGQFYRVVDEKGADCPDYVSGELWIGGSGVAQGYVGDNELTASKFVTDMGKRWYRTGDSGQFWNDGTIEFLGRMDNQIKVRGHRIELGEIESAVSDFGGIGNAVVCVRDHDGTKQIVAFAVCSDRDALAENGGLKRVSAPFGDIAVSEYDKVYDKAEETEAIRQADEAYLRGAEKILKALESEKADDYDIYTEAVESWKKDVSERGENKGEENDFDRFTAPFINKAADILCGRMNANELLLSDDFVSPNVLADNMPRGRYLNGMIRNFLRRVSESSQRKLKVLEVGARDCAVSSEFAAVSDNISYTVLDKTRFFISRAQEALGDRAEYIIADLNAEKDPVAEDMCFDVIILSNTLHQYLNAPDVLKKLSRHLSLGGVILFTEMTEDMKLQNITSFMLKEEYTDSRAGTDSMLLTEKQWDKVIADCGLERLEASCGDSYQQLFAARNNAENGSNTYFHEEAVLNYLESVIPEYMIPAHIVLREEFPLTANGKIDRKLLVSQYEQSNVEKRVLADTEELTDTEKRLCDIWSRVLDTEVHKNSHYFKLGGDSLLATMLSAEIRKGFGADFSLEMIFSCPVLENMAACIDEMLASADSGIAQQEITAPELIRDPDGRFEKFPMTEVQQAYWIGRTEMFNYSDVSTHCYFEMDCPDIDVKYAEKVWNKLILTHDMLRAVICTDGQNQQVLEKVPYYEISFDDLSDSSEAERKTVLDSIRSELSGKKYDTSVWPLFDIKAAKLGNGVTRLFISFDNIIFDGWSMFYLFREWNYHYHEPDAVYEGEEVSFRDYVLSCEKLNSSESYDNDLDYWESRIDDISPAPEFSIKSDKLGTANRFIRLAEKVDSTVWSPIKEKLRKYSVTPSSFLMAAYAEAIALWSKSEKFSINLTHFNRIGFSEGINRTVGDFTSLTIHSVDQRSGRSFSERMQNVQKSLWEELNHNLVSGVTVERMLNSKRRIGSMPVVFTSGIGLEQGMDDRYRGYLGTINYGLSQTPQVWLDHQVYEENGGLSVSWDVLIDIFPENMAEQMFEAYIGLLSRLSKDDSSWEKLCGNIVETPDEELRRKLNDTSIELPEDTLIGLFEKSAEKYPDRNAVESNEKTLTYHELDMLAENLAEKLASNGFGSGDIAGILIKKGWQQIAAILAIHKLGGIYLPLNVLSPYSRNRDILADSGAKVLITAIGDAESQKLYSGDITVVEVEDKYSSAHTVSPAKPYELAYIIYTSGTTGKPKGAALLHSGAVNTILDVNRRLSVTNEDKTIAISDLSFDLSVYDIFGMFAAGGTIVMPEQDRIREPSHWAELLEKYHVTLWNTVPMFMQMFLSYLEFNELKDKSPLRAMLLSGDWIPLTIRQDTDKYLGGCDIYGLGGATEASVWSNIFKVDKVDPEWKSIPYGKPLANQRYYVLNSMMQECPVNVVGDLYIGGAGIALCYWRDETNTSASFTEHPVTGERLYKTGDMAMYRADGNIEFCGRDDGQVKINGFRIELEEINKQIAEDSAVKQAASVVRGNEIYSFAVLEGNTISEAIISRLREVLPAYMIPSDIIFTDKLPLTGNGKVDRKQLINMITEKTDEPAENEEFTERESEIRSLWANVIGTDRIRRNDEFIRIGGSSLAAVRLINLINNEYAVEMTISDFYQNSTVAKLAEYIDAQLGDEEIGSL